MESEPDFYDPDEAWTLQGHHQALREVLGVTSLRKTIHLQEEVNEIRVEETLPDMS